MFYCFTHSFNFGLRIGPHIVIHISVFFIRLLNNKFHGSPLTSVWPGVPKQPVTTVPSSRSERHLTVFCSNEIVLGYVVYLVNCSIILVHCYLFIICLPIFGNVLLILAKAHVLHWGTIFGKFYATWNRALIAFEALLNLPWIWFTMGKYIHKKKAGLSGIIFNRAE